MKKNSKQSKIDKYGLCLNEYENNFNNAKVYFDRATGRRPEMEVSKALSLILKQNKKMTNVSCWMRHGHYYRSIKKG